MILTLTLATGFAAPRRAASPRASEIAVDVAWFRSAKAALRAALAAEAGVLSADAAALVTALSSVNPTRPDPSVDYDLWSGTFSLESASLTPPGGGVVQSGAAEVEVTPDSLHLSAAVRSAVGSEDELSLSLRGSLSATCCDELELRCEPLALEAAGESCAEGETLVDAVAAATGLSFRAVSEARWEADVPTLYLAQLFLDQALLAQQPPLPVHIERDSCRPRPPLHRRRSCTCCSGARTRPLPAARRARWGRRAMRWIRRACSCYFDRADADE